MQAHYFVSGTGTEVGKTVVSALLCRVLDADYWKPIQSGELDYSDSDKVREWSGRRAGQVHPEAFRLHTPASPHFSAAAEGLRIEVSKQAFPYPPTSAPLIVEGAGGLLVPLNERETTVDLIRLLGLPVILVARNYLGSINHTLLSIELLRTKNIPLVGVIYSGADYRDNVEIIERISGAPTLARLPEMERVDVASIEALASRISQKLIGRLNA